MTSSPTYFTAHLREIDGSYVQPNHFQTPQQNDSKKAD